MTALRSAPKQTATAQESPMKLLHYLTIAVAAAFVAGSVPSFAAASTEESREKSIQMSQVPKPARDAAAKALGATPTEAKIVNGTSPQEYELEAKTAGKAKAVHV